MIYVDTIKCDRCKKSAEVVHTGKISRRNLAESELIKNGSETICYDCEALEMEGDCPGEGNPAQWQ